MKHRRINYLSASIVVLLAALFRAFLLTISLYTLIEYNKESTLAEKLPLSQILNFESLFPPLVLFAEAVVYVVLRKRLFYRKLVRWHTWMTILSSVVFPIAEIIIVNAFLRHIYAPVEMAPYEKYVLFFGWALFAVARLFFITAMVKSVTSPNELIQTNEPSGFLDEFAK